MAKEPSRLCVDEVCFLFAMNFIYVAAIVLCLKKHKKYCLKDIG